MSNQSFKKYILITKMQVCQTFVEEASLWLSNELILYDDNNFRSFCISIP